jgi:quercetin dioxygenase-like cupin family protein
VWRESPAPLSGQNDDGNLPYDFPGPPGGGHLRAVYGKTKPANYDPEKDPKLKPFHDPVERPAGKTWDRGGRNAWTSDMHKTETVDYAILLKGQRNLVLDDCEVTWRPGDVVIDVAAYHQWTSPDEDGLVLYDMIAARFVDGPAGLLQGNDPVLRPQRDTKLPEGVKPARRIVCADREPGRSSLICDGPTPDVRLDPARPGFASQRMWVTDDTPAKIVAETLHLPHALEPPRKGSVMRVVTCAYAREAPHPYMQKTKTLDFCVVLEGEIVLQLDSQEVGMKAGEIAIVRGSRHAWSNRSNNPAVVAIASHDGS